MCSVHLEMFFLISVTLVKLQSSIDPFSRRCESESSSQLTRVDRLSTPLSPSTQEQRELGLFTSSWMYANGKMGTVSYSTWNAFNQQRALQRTKHPLHSTTDQQPGRPFPRLKAARHWSLTPLRSRWSPTWKEMSLPINLAVRRPPTKIIVPACHSLLRAAPLMPEIGLHQWINKPHPDGEFRRVTSQHKCSHFSTSPGTEHASILDRSETYTVRITHEHIRVKDHCDFGANVHRLPNDQVHLRVYLQSQEQSACRLYP